MKKTWNWRIWKLLQYVFVCVCVWPVCVCVWPVFAHMWKSEEKNQDLVLFYFLFETVSGCVRCVCVCVLQSPELSCLCLLPLRWVCYMSSGTWTHTLCSQDNCIIHWTISSAFSSVVCTFSDLHSFSESNNNISESSSPLQMLQVNRIIQFFFSSYTLSCCVLSKRLRRAIRYFAFLF